MLALDLISCWLCYLCIACFSIGDDFTLQIVYTSYSNMKVIGLQKCMLGILETPWLRLPRNERPHLRLVILPPVDPRPAASDCKLSLNLSCDPHSCCLGAAASPAAGTCNPPSPPPTSTMSRRFSHLPPIQVTDHQIGRWLSGFGL